MYNLEEFLPGTYKIAPQGGMRVPGLVIATDKILADADMEQPLTQVCNVAHLAGIVGYSIAMPDIHWGYGFPIGGVAATDAATGVISPGGVGYDINCGVRLAIISLPYKSLSPAVRDQLLQRIFHLVPSGMGKGKGKMHKLTDSDYAKIAKQGAEWSVEQGFGFKEDLMHSESHGCIAGADIDAVSSYAKERGRDQLGSIGSGNHFVEIGAVQKVLLPEIAEAWNVQEGDIYILIHSGSRGFGHQICQDTLNHFLKKGYAEGLPDKQLVAAPINSPDGKQYFAAMASAANFAFNNRQQILHGVREAFSEILRIKPHEVRLIYDVCHNIAKMEEHEVEGKKRTLCVHRKGATRAFGPNHPELAPLFKKTGQPVLVPGDMGRASYLLVGEGNPLTWCSCCHGAGRARSRHHSLKAWSGRDPIESMRAQGVSVMATSYRTIAEEMPDAYKDVDIVVEAVEKAKLARIVARLKPHLVIKG